MTTPEKKELKGKIERTTIEPFPDTTFDDLNPSQEILRLCKELNIEPPKMANLYTAWAIPPYTPTMTTSDLLKWDGWGDGIAPAVTKEKLNASGIFVAWDESRRTGELYEEHSDPDTALQHLAIARLRQIKQEKEK